MAERFTYSLDGLTLTIKMTGGTWGTYYRFFVRYANNASSSVYDANHYCPQSGTLSVDIDLDKNTSYAFNAGPFVNGATTWYWSTAPTVTTGSGSGGGTTVTRPNNWYWYSTIRSGAAIAITALEWNDFCVRINDFRDYCGLSAYGFSTVYRGTAISYWLMNQAINGISAIPGHGWLPSLVSMGDTITANFFLTLQSALNAIP